jgi:hypothetical protein
VNLLLLTHNRNPPGSHEVLRGSERPTSGGTSSRAISLTARGSRGGLRLRHSGVTVASTPSRDSEASRSFHERLLGCADSEVPRRGDARVPMIATERALARSIDHPGNDLPQLCLLLVHMPKEIQRLPIDLVVMFGLIPIACGLAILAHENNGACVRGLE